MGSLGRYELITQIGQGGMAEVQLALQRGPAGFEKLVVVKLVHEHLAAQTAFVDMLLDEARVAAMVKHPNVAKYMQATFAAHLGARRKLLQEVSSKGKASADVVEAAFTEQPPLSPGGELSVRIRRESGEMLTNEEAQLRRRREPTDVGAPARGSGTTVPPPLVDQVPPGTGTRAMARGPAWRLLVALGAGAVVLAIIVVLLRG
ncbi:MAG: hypothetical protein SFX73_20095 [Kofleriaceae bacterium]|nr:hypothetical protein [Kofleriaceae bacterium]